MVRKIDYFSLKKTESKARAYFAHRYPQSMCMVYSVYLLEQHTERWENHTALLFKLVCAYSCLYACIPFGKIFNQNHLTT